MNNPVLMLVHNGLANTQRAIASVLAQTVPVVLMVIDNDSPPELGTWLMGLDVSDHGKQVTRVRFAPQAGVSAGWNFGLKLLYRCGAEHVLVVGNDTEMPPTFYERLLSREVGFVTGTATESRELAFDPTLHGERVLAPAPDFSAFLMRRQVWDTVGEFDEDMVHYASDCDYHVRAHRAGMGLWKSMNDLFYHERSSTLRNASYEDRLTIEARANADREVFRQKYGCSVGTAEYAALFAPLEVTEK